MHVNTLSAGVRTAVAALALVIAPAAFGQRPHSTAADRPVWDQTAKDAVIEQMTKYLENSAYVPGIDFSKWKEVIPSLRETADKAENEEQFAGAINRALHDEFKISHIVLMPPRAVEARTNQTTVGIGIRINQAADGVLVVSTVPGAPAEKAGIEPGDTIMEADGHKVDGPAYIAGPEGSSVKLKVKKNDGTIKEYKVVRSKFKTSQPETLTWVNKDTAALRIYTFDLSYSTENVDNLMKEASKAKNLLIDLRGNGGGAVSNMMHFLSTVLDPNTAIGTFVNKRIVDAYTDKGGNPNDLKAVAESSSNKLRVFSRNVPVFKGNIAVLVNAGSGSASEITAQALREAKSVPVIGQKSAGAVLVSVMGQLPHGFNLQYPISDYVSVKGVRLEANGIVPDMEAADRLFIKKGETDPAYLTAITALNKAAAKAGNAG